MGGRNKKVKTDYWKELSYATWKNKICMDFG
jgi:hypothetical protein